MSSSCTVEELRFVSGSSNKFYRAYVVVDGSRSLVVFQWGRRGSVGQSKVVVGGTPSHARRVAEAQLRSKRLEGYEQAWAPEALEAFPLSRDAILAKHLAAAWNLRQQELLHSSLAAIPDAVASGAGDAVLLLQRFDVEERSELVAATLSSSLGRLAHARGRHGVAVALPHAAATALARGYSHRWYVLHPTVPVDAALLEVLVGLWDPSASGPLSSPEGALEMASAIV